MYLDSCPTSFQAPSWGAHLDDVSHYGDNIFLSLFLMVECHHGSTKQNINFLITDWFHEVKYIPYLPVDDWLLYGKKVMRKKVLMPQNILFSRIRESLFSRKNRCFQFAKVNSQTKKLIFCQR